MPEDNDALDWFSQNYGDLIQANNAVIASYDARYALPEVTAPWQQLGALQGFQPIENGVSLRCAQGAAELVWLAADLLRVRVRGADQFEDGFSYAIARAQWPSINCAVLDTEARLVITTGALVTLVDKATSRIQVNTRDDQPIYREAEGYTWQPGGASRLSVHLAEREASYGLGERAFSLNLRGRKLALWNKDAGSYTYGYEPINYSVPLYLGLHVHGAYGIFWDNPARGSVDIGATQPDELVFSSTTATDAYYILVGASLLDVLARYTELTGRMPMPPLWALGYHQCRYSYYPEADVMETARILRERQIPCDALYLDIHYMDGYRVFTWDRQSFPDFKRMIDDLHALGFKVVVILDPGVKVDPQYAAYLAGLEADIFVKYPDGEIAQGVVWPGLCVFPDFTNPKARVWWAAQLEPLLAAGVDGLWNDMNEPLYFAEKIAEDPPDYLRHDYEGRGAAHRDVHNVYGMQMARASLLALKKQRPGQRQLNITRAGYAGTQRLASSWMGDNTASWECLRLSVSMMINLGLSGVPFTGADVGGFAGDTTPELLTRWTQANSLFPFFRNHSAVDTLRQEPYRFGQPYENICRAAIELRYRLMPYLYSVVAECHFTGHPIIRPLFMAEPHNRHLHSVDDCYLVGDALLVAPVLHEFALRRMVYLPAGDWYDYWTNERFSGSQWIEVDAPLARLPLFVKSGTALPMQPVMPTLTENPIERLTLRVYADTGTTRLYQDAGDGLEYEQGEYRWVTIQCMETTNTLLIEQHSEGRYTPPRYETEVQMVGATSIPVRVEVDGILIEGWTVADGVLSVVTPGFRRMLITTQI